VLHEGAQSAGVDGPVVDGLILVELGVDCCFWLKGQPVGGSDTVSAADLCDEAALLFRAVVNGDFDSLYGGDIVAVAGVASCSGAEDGKECLSLFLGRSSVDREDHRHTLMYIIQKNFSRY